MSTASPGALWQQAYEETKDLPSFQRGERCRDRYFELLDESGLLVRGSGPVTLPCGKRLGNRAARR
jgi:hypothetical protein